MSKTLTAARAAYALATLVAVTLPLSATSAKADGEINVYSYREPGLINPLLERFTKEAGIKINSVFAKDGLIERMQAEGKISPADVLLTNESGLLFKAEADGVTQPLKSETLEKAIPAALRDSAGHWFALTRRARIVYASNERVKDTAMTYEDLADPNWKGKICSRSGQHTYNIALIASMIAHHGEEKAEAWLTGLRDNLARKHAGGDREGVKDVQAGLCDLAIGNTYYMYAMQKNPEQKVWADAVHIVFPNAADRGTHVNVSGMALAANAPNKANAVKFMEWLASPEAQKIYAAANGEYPVTEGAETTDLIKSWGPLKADPIPLEKLAELRKKASELVDKVRFDQGPSS
jgi:iron(III) transport system substrate-binding protein